LSADLIVGIDPLLEPWLNELVISNKLVDKVIWLGKPWISSAGNPKHDSHICSSDPHIWTDPKIVQMMIEELTATCAQLNGIDRTKLAARKDAYLKSIQQLDQTLSADFSKIPTEQRVVVTHHNNFSRFAERYGIKVVGVILDSSSTEAADPSAKHLARLIQQVRAEHVSLIICDRGERAPAAQLLARETGLPPPIALNLDSLDKQGTRGGTWLGMMNEVAAALIHQWKEVK
jgi:ABC-type Zn uptake system ZnuABC Zn-binding protein ZnuA